MRSGSWLLSRSGFAGLSLAFVLWAPGVKADAIQSAPGLTDISFQLRVKTNAASSYAAVTHPEKWWNGEHSYSGDASNMTLDTSAGGCWCGPCRCNWAPASRWAAKRAPDRLRRGRSAR